MSNHHHGKPRDGQARSFAGLLCGGCLNRGFRNVRSAIFVLERPRQISWFRVDCRAFVFRDYLLNSGVLFSPWEPGPQSTPAAVRISSENGAELSPMPARNNGSVL